MFRKIPKKFLLALLLGAMSQTTQVHATDNEPTQQQIKVAEDSYHQQEETHFSLEEAKKYLSTFHKQSRENFFQGIEFLQNGNKKNGSTLITSVFQFIQQRNKVHFSELKQFEKASEKGDPDNVFYHNLALKAQTIQTNINAQRAMIIILAQDAPGNDELLQKCYSILQKQEKEFHNYIR